MNPNGLSIGIELREPDHPIIDHFTNEQYSSLSQLIRTRALMYNIPVNRDTVLGHYDLNPISRGDKRGDWDPGESFNWNRLLTTSSI
jgi:N-acetyl-anhydromuramyl-L-alanine amidase AmpD